MIKTIKVKKQFRLDELIKYIFDNGIRNTSFSSNIKLEPNHEYKNKVYVQINGEISLGLSSLNRVTKEDMYTVEVEEEITEDTTFERLVTLGCRGTINVHDDKSLSDLNGKKEYGAQVFALINGKLELIWEAE